MPGNEEQLLKFFAETIEQNLSIDLPVIGKLNSVSVPTKDGLHRINSVSELESFSSNDRYKKADIYLNNIGVSVKEHSAPLYNKIQRKHLANLLDQLLGSSPRNLEIINKLDDAVRKVNEGSNRDIKWNTIFSQDEFYQILNFLMMRGYADLKESLHPAELILVAPKITEMSNVNEVTLLSFSEFFDNYKENIVIAARRIWLGSKSNIENKRAKSMLKSIDNQSWVYEKISGAPRSWDPQFPIHDRKEIFYLNINT